MKLWKIIFDHHKKKNYKQIRFRCATSVWFRRKSRPLQRQGQTHNAVRQLRHVLPGWSVDTDHKPKRKLWHLLTQVSNKMFLESLYESDWCQYDHPANEQYHCNLNQCEHFLLSFFATVQNVPNITLKVHVDGFIHSKHH